jgi:hypothetical protein
MDALVAEAADRGVLGALELLLVEAQRASCGLKPRAPAALARMVGRLMDEQVAAPLRPAPPRPAPAETSGPLLTARLLPVQGPQSAPSLSPESLLVVARCLHGTDNTSALVALPRLAKSLGAPPSLELVRAAPPRRQLTPLCAVPPGARRDCAGCVPVDMCGRVARVA